MKIMIVENEQEILGPDNATVYENVDCIHKLLTTFAELVTLFVARPEEEELKKIYELSCSDNYEEFEKIWKSMLKNYDAMETLKDWLSERIGFVEDEQDIVREFKDNYNAICKIADELATDPDITSIMSSINDINEHDERYYEMKEALEDIQNTCDNVL